MTYRFPCRLCRLALQAGLLLCATVLCGPPCRAAGAPRAEAAPDMFGGADWPTRIVVADDSSYAPFAFIDAQGSPQGITIEIWRLWSRKTGIPVQFRLMEWEAALAAVKTGNADVVGGLFLTPERQRDFAFTKPYFEIHTSVFFDREVVGIRGLSDLDGFTVGVVRGDEAEERLLRDFPRILPVACAGTEELVRTALRGKLNVFVADSDVAKFYLAKLGGSARFREAEESVSVNKQYAAVKKGNDQLLNLVQQGFNQISAAEKQAVVDRWTGRTLLARLPWFAIGIASGIALLIIVLLLVGHAQLRHQVAKAVAQVQRHEQLFRDTFEQAAIGIGHIRLDGRWLRVNRRLCEILGYTREELLGGTLQGITHADDLPVLQKTMQDMRERRLSFGVKQQRCVRRDGTAIWIHLTAAVVHGQAATADYCICTLADVSALRRAEEELALRHTLLITQQEASPDGILAVDGNNRIFSANRRFIDMWRLSSELAAAKDDVPVLEWVSRQNQDPVAFLARVRHLYGHRQEKGRDELVLIDGRVFDRYSAPMSAPDGTYLGRVWHFRDITEQRRAEQALRENEEFFRNLFHVSPYTLTVNRLSDGVYLAVNQAFCRAIGLQADAVVGRLTTATAFGLSTESIDAMRLELLAHGCILDRELTVAPTDGRPPCHVLYSAIITTYKGEPCALAVATDVTPLKNTEARLRAALQQLHDIIEFLPDATFVVDNDRRVIAWNRAAEQLTGIPKARLTDSGGMTYGEAFYGKPSPCLIDLLDLPATPGAHYHAVTRNGNALYAETFLPHVNRGTGAHVWISAAPLYDAQGRRTGAIEVVRDITQRKQAECRLQESEEKYRELVQSASSIILRLDGDGNITFFNEYAQRFFGYTEAEVLNRSVVGTIVPEQESTGRDLQEMIRQLCRNPDAFSFNENENIRRHGERAWIAWTNRPLLAADGTPAGVLCVGTDITARKQADEQLRASEKRAALQRSAVVELALGQVFAESDISSALPRVAEILCATLEVARGSVWSLSDDGSELRCLARYDAARRNRGGGEVLLARQFPAYFEAIRTENRVCAEDVLSDPRTCQLPASYWAETGIASLLDAGVFVGGRLIGVVCGEHVGPKRKWYPDEESFISTVAAIVAQFFLNLRRQQAEAQARERERLLVQADKMASLGVLVAGVAHEINNPTNLIMLNSDIATRLWQQLEPQLREALTPATLTPGRPLPKTGETMGKMLAGISGGAVRIRNIVQHLRDFARLDPGAMDERVNLQEVVQAATLLVEGLIKKSTDRFTVEATPGIPPVNGNFQKLEQVVVNLLTNACQALPDRSRGITVSIDHDAAQGRAWVRVADQGCGIPADVLPRILDPFFTTKRDRGGTGLGLSVSYGIVKEHAGDLTFVSQEGQGTTAALFLPLALPATNGSAAATSPGAEL